MKKLNFADKHLEKIVIGVGAAAAVAAAWFFVVSSPNQVDVGGRAMQPGEVPQRLSAEAENLQLSLATVHELPVNEDLPKYAERFAERDRDPVADRVALGPIGAPGSNRGGDLEALTPFTVPRPPLAFNPVARQGVAVFAPVGEARVDEPVIRLISGDNEPVEPYDFRYVTVGATFDYDAWRERLREGKNPIREDWWQDSLDITGVFLQRQTLNRKTGEWEFDKIIDPQTGEALTPEQLAQLEDADKPWAGHPIIPTLPDREAYDADDTTADLPSDTITELLNFIREQQAEMRRPAFVSTRFAHQFRDPFGIQRTPDQELELEDVLGDIENATKQIQRIDDSIARGRGGTNIETRRDLQMQQLMEAVMRRNELVGQNLPMPEVGDMPQASNPEGGFGGPQAGRRGMDDDFGDPMAQRRGPGQANRNNPRFNQRPPQGPGRDPMADGFNRQRFNPDGFGRGNFGDPMTGDSGAIMEAQVSYDGTVRVWAHDLTVEPGKTYRYRVLITVRNPLLRKTRVAAEQKLEFFDRLTLGPSKGELDATADPSTENGEPFWTEPITIDPELHYFLVRGNPPNSAEVEVWRVYNGRWRNENFVIAPGDPIGGTASLSIDGEPIQLLMQADDLAVDIVPAAGGGGGLGGADSRLIVIDAADGEMFSRSALRDREAIERVRLRNENQVNDLLEAQEGGDTFAIRQ
ncbi:MAG: hypothetical protein AAF823_07635 [Planctomycetota bacterium]